MRCLEERDGEMHPIVIIDGNRYWILTAANNVNTIEDAMPFSPGSLIIFNQQKVNKL